MTASALVWFKRRLRAQDHTPPAEVDAIQSRHGPRKAGLPRTGPRRRGRPAAPAAAPRQALS